MTLSPAETILRLAVAAVLGGVVGLERERLERAAGLRTHAVVAVASALITVVSAFGFADAVTSSRTVVLDPSRVAAQVVSGIGFLGAGVIIFQQSRVRGLTTAASIWSVAGIGLAAGSGLFLAAGVGTLLVLAIQAGLRPVERRFFGGREELRLTLRLRQGAGRLATIERVLAAAPVETRRMRLREEDGEDRVDLDLGPAPATVTASLVETLRAIEGVRVTGFIREQVDWSHADTGDAFDEIEGRDAPDTIGADRRL